MLVRYPIAGHNPKHNPKGENFNLVHGLRGNQFTALRQDVMAEGYDRAKLLSSQQPERRARERLQEMDKGRCVIAKAMAPCMTYSDTPRNMLYQIVRHFLIQ